MGGTADDGGREDLPEDEANARVRGPGFFTAFLMLLRGVNSRSASQGFAHRVSNRVFAHGFGAHQLQNPVILSRGLPRRNAKLAHAGPAVIYLARQRKEVARVSPPDWHGRPAP